MAAEADRLASWSGLLVAVGSVAWVLSLAAVPVVYSRSGMIAWADRLPFALAMSATVLFFLVVICWRAGRAKFGTIRRKTWRLFLAITPLCVILGLLNLLQ